jgi:hypothetical protein
MRIVPLVTAVTAVMLHDPGSSQAYEGPWRALGDIGGGVMQDCSMRGL